MRSTTMVAVSAAAAAAAAAVSGGAASASTPDWLTVATVDTGHDSMLPAVCESDAAGPLADTACGSLLSADTEGRAAAYGRPLAESSGDFGGMPTLVNANLRNFAKWQVCGIAVATSAAAADCDNSIQRPSEPVRPRSGNSLVNVDITGAFQWSVCGIAVGQIVESTDC
jgi:hypothetical protein